jgi:16S rRNA (cytidine1402-2'-O)-methyltransferase
MTKDMKEGPSGRPKRNKPRSKTADAKGVSKHKTQILTPKADAVQDLADRNNQLQDSQASQASHADQTSQTSLGGQADQASQTGRTEAPLAPGLYLLPSPLGNLGDLSLRACRILSAADLIAAEDTRRTLKLLNHLNLKKTLVSYREQNHNLIWPKILSRLRDKQVVALISDAGSPAIADPGAKLVREARKEGFDIFPIPGPSAVITALMACGFPISSFTFGGFLPSKASQRRLRLSALKDLNQVLVFFESPHRLVRSVSDMAEILGPRQALMAREMTKLHEEYLYLTLDELLAELTANPRRGEVTLVIGPSVNESINETSDRREPKHVYFEGLTELKDLTDLKDLKDLIDLIDLEDLADLDGLPCFKDVNDSADMKDPANIKDSTDAKDSTNLKKIVAASARPTKELAALLAEKSGRTKKEMYDLIISIRREPDSR